MRQGITKQTVSSVPELRDDPQLLSLLLSDARTQAEIYRAGPYWHRHGQNAVAQTWRYGLEDFRGTSSTIGLSYSDVVHLDVRHALTVGIARRAVRTILMSVFPINNMFDSQVSLTRSHADAARRLRRLRFAEHPRVRDLLARYRMPYSLLGGCVESVNIDGVDVSMHYLALLERHDHLAQRLDFSAVRSVFEIGGGFGVNVHLLLENHPNIRKVVYLDIPPALYVGTQYLRSFYGDAVQAYGKLRARPRITFRQDDSLEILCVPSWQVDRLDMVVDLFYNAYSFVEMPTATVAHYARHVTRLLDKRSGAIALLSYDCFDRKTTFDPAHLPGFFPSCRFSQSSYEVIEGTHHALAFLAVMADGQAVSTVGNRRCT